MMSRPQDRPVFPSSAKIQEKLLILLFEYGGDDKYAIWAWDTYRPLADLFGLNDEARTIPRDACNGDGRSEAYWHTLVQTARDKLVGSGDLYKRPNPHRTGIWQLTEQGKCRAKQLTAGRPRVAFAHRTPITPVSDWCLTNPPSPKPKFTLKELGLI